MSVVGNATMIFLVMGVSGCGKSTVGKLLAQRMALDFYDADDFHSEVNIQKMRNGIPLEDADRLPWLLDLATRIPYWNKTGGAVLACSALREKYRAILSHDGKERVAFIHLAGGRQAIRDRMALRKDHFFSPSLLEDQWNILEAPETAVTVSCEDSADTICANIINGLTLAGLMPIASPKGGSYGRDK